MTLRTSTRRLLTGPLAPDQARRLRLHLALIPVYVWAVIAWCTLLNDISVPGRLDRSGHIKGHDFAHFYMLGGIARDRAAADLYSYEAQAARMDRLVPEYPARFLPVHTPQVAMFFAPIAGMSYPTAVIVWLLISGALYGLCCSVLWRILPALRPCAGLVAALAIGFPAFQCLIATGQTSAFALAWLTLAYVALARRFDVLAGVALGMLVYKPTYGLLFPVALCLTRQFRIIMVAAITAAVQFGMAWMYFGTRAFTAYVDNFQVVAAQRTLLEAQPQAMHSLLAFFTLLVPSSPVANLCYLMASAGVAAIAFWTWRGHGPLALRYASLLIASVLVSPHFYAYDLVILVPVFFLAASWGLTDHTRRPMLWALLYLSYYLPGLEGLVHLTHIQWSVPILLGLLIYLMLASASAERVVETTECHYKAQ